MTAVIIAQVIGQLANVLIILIFIWVIVSWILSPYHPLREALDRLVEPMLAPIRRVVPMVGMLDLSPMILMILIELTSRILISVLSSTLR
ncbi:MAG TPA: YggT family protein [Anaerolineales bacterium]